MNAKRWMEKRLVRRVVGGDRPAGERFIRDYYLGVYKLLLHLCRDSHRAEDLTQDAFAAALAALKNFDGRCGLATWLRRIAFNKFLDSQRRRQRRSAIEGPPLADDPPAPERPDALETLEREGQLRRALDGLDEPQRQVVVLHYVRGLSYRETAALLGEPVGTVKWRTARALEHLRGRLEKGGES